jgi:hypothetical protein
MRLASLNSVILLLLFSLVGLGSPWVGGGYTPFSVAFANDTSPEKQVYDPGYFRHRALLVLQKIAPERTKTLWYQSDSGQKHYELRTPDFSWPEFQTKPMNEWYSDEQITYFTKAGLEKAQVFIVNGKVYQSDLSFYSSKVELNSETGDGEMIVLDRLGNAFIHPKERGILHHSSFFSGAPLAFAGLVFIQDGKIEKLLPYSGHYSPGDQEVSNWRKVTSREFMMKESAYKAVEKNDQSYLVFDKGFASNYGFAGDFDVDTELNVLYDIKYSSSRDEKYTFRRIDLHNGDVLSNTALPSSPAGFVVTKSHIVVLGEL